MERWRDFQSSQRKWEKMNDWEETAPLFSSPLLHYLPFPAFFHWHLLSFFHSHILFSFHFHHSFSLLKPFSLSLLPPLFLTLLFWYQRSLDWLIKKSLQRLQYVMHFQNTAKQKWLSDSNITALKIVMHFWNQVNYTVQIAPSAAVYRQLVISKMAVII